MKKLNRKGFTLIELLAVITIMGILMVVAQQAFSRIMENARRDTFVDTTKKYINAVRTSVLSGDIECQTTFNGSEYIDANVSKDGVYYFIIDTTAKSVNKNVANSASGGHELLESGGKSSFGNADIKGYIKWEQTNTTITASGSSSKNTTKKETKYYARLADTTGHGMTAEESEDQITRSSIAISGATAPTPGDVKPTDSNKRYYCRVK